MGEKLQVPPQPSREEETRAAGSRRKWRKPQECFQQGRLGEQDPKECPDENSGEGEGKSQSGGGCAAP